MNEPGSTGPRFKRPLVKLSGEMLGGWGGSGFDPGSIETFCREIAELVNNGISPAIVIGGGNFFRGAHGHLPALRRHRADFIGMLATVMNSLCFSDHLAYIGVQSEVFSAVPMPSICPSFQVDQARKALDSGVVTIIAGGTGNPYFTTDSAAALRAVEVGSDVLIKATKVDGVYDADPVKFPEARKFDRISYSEVLERNLGIMDLGAITLCRENRMPLIVLSLAQSQALLRACRGEKIGTEIVEHS